VLLAGRIDDQENALLVAAREHEPLGLDWSCLASH